MLQLGFMVSLFDVERCLDLPIRQTIIYHKKRGKWIPVGRSGRGVNDFLKWCLINNKESPRFHIWHGVE